MYKPDLDPYASTSTDLAVGWLESGQTFSMDDVPNGFLDKLFLYCLHPYAVSRGTHICEFCQEPLLSVIVMSGKTMQRLGSNVIQISGENDLIYIAPDLIYHYVEAHNYCPPQEFIDAVMNSEPPGSKSWWQSCRQRVSQLFAHSE